MRTMFAICVVVGLLSACAGRSPEPVQVTQRTDTRLSCAEMDAEIASNNDRISGLYREEDDKRAQNILAVAGAILVFPPLLFAMDFQDAAGIEREALQQRQFRLAQLSSRRCGKNRQVVSLGRQQQGLAGNTGTSQREATEIAAAARAAIAYPPVTGSPPLFEGSSYAAFTPEQLQAYCQQSWQTRTGTTGRTEYNPCTQRAAFQ